MAVLLLVRLGRGFVLAADAVQVRLEEGRSGSVSGARHGELVGARTSKAAQLTIPSRFVKRLRSLSVLRLTRGIARVPSTGAAPEEGRRAAVAARAARDPVFMRGR